MGLFVKSFLLRRVVLIVTVTETAEVKYHDENSHWQKKKKTSLAVQWLRLHASNAGVQGLIPDWGTRIPHAV